MSSFFNSLDSALVNAGYYEAVDTVVRDQSGREMARTIQYVSPTAGVAVAIETRGEDTLVGASTADGSMVLIGALPFGNHSSGAGISVPVLMDCVAAAEARVKALKNTRR